MAQPPLARAGSLRPLIGHTPHMEAAGPGVTLIRTQASLSSHWSRAQTLTSHWLRPEPAVIDTISSPK